MSENVKKWRIGRTRTTIVAAAVGALVAAPLAAWAAVDFNDVPPSHPAYEEINAVADAGIMTGDGQGNFRPGQRVTKAALAEALYRGLGRFSVDGSVDDIPANTSPDPVRIAELGISIDGFQRGHQGVLLEHTMQLRFSPALPAACNLTLFATSWPENLEAGQWTTHLPRGSRTATVDAIFTDSQLAETAYTYEITAAHNCGQAIDVVQGAFVGQTGAFRGGGLPFPPG